MNKKITSQPELLAYQLEELYDGEKKLQHVIHALIDTSDAFAFKEDLQKFERQCSEARMKIKRIFSYLMVDSFGIKNNTIVGFIKDFERTMEYVEDAKDRQLFTKTLIQGINSYKLSLYEVALGLSHKVDQDQVADLLKEIIESIIGCDERLQKMQNHDL
jgi:ferritin-like metal-binding protein YciE